MPFKPSLFSNQPFQGGASFVDLICYLVSLPCLFLAVWETADVLAFFYVMFSCVIFHYPICCPESGVVHDCDVPDLWLLSCIVL